LLKNPVRNELLEAGRRGGFSELAFSDHVSSALRIPELPGELNVRPAARGGTTGRLIVTGKPKSDCDTQPCSSDWVMVRVPTPDGKVDGWIRAVGVAPAPAIRSEPLRFAERSVVPDPQSIKRLREFIRAAKDVPEARIEVLAVVSQQASERDILLANARATNVVNSLFRRVADPLTVVSRVVAAADTGTVAPVTVELISPFN
jgi:hypothetical protein